jgi:tRNA (cmo5U34)-methyltransferase
MKIDKKLKINNNVLRFNKTLSQNFDSHVKKSVPFYEISHEITTELSKFFLKDNSRYYDLGCSTGTLIEKIDKSNAGKKLELIGVDESKFMIDIAKKKKKKIIFKKERLNDFQFKKSDLITSLYTIQFIKPSYRQDLFNKIYKSLNWGGAFIIFEKIRGNDARFQDILNFLYFDFKKKIGKLSSEDIINKEKSLRGILDPFTINANKDFLKRAGFKDFMPICQYLCFIGFLAIK